MRILATKICGFNLEKCELSQKRKWVYTKKCNCTHKNMSTTNCKQTNERSNKQTNKPTNKQTDKQTNKQASKHVCKRGFSTFYQGTAIPKLVARHVGLRYWLSLLGLIGLMVRKSLPHFHLDFNPHFG